MRTTTTRLEDPVSAVVRHGAWPLHDERNDTHDPSTTGFLTMLTGAGKCTILRRVSAGESNRLLQSFGTEMWMRFAPAA
jgi:hypothetical protein